MYNPRRPVRTMLLPRSIVLLGCLALGLGCAPGEEAGPQTGPGAATPAAVGASGEAAVFGRAPAATSGMPSVVMLDRLDGPTPPRADDPVFVDQVGYAFFPLVQLVRRGEPVVFGNAEDVMHNVHAVDIESGDTAFNVSTAPGMPGYRHVFEEAGVYRLQCGIHPAMLGFVVVAPGPWASIAAADGSFRIEAVPAGRYRLAVWSAEAGLATVGEIDLGSGAELEIDASSGQPSASAPPA